MLRVITKLLASVIPVKRYRHLLKDFAVNGGMDLLRTHVPKLYYYRGKNFGDCLNLDLLDYYGVNPIYAPQYFTDACCIGSILDDFVVTPKLCRNSKTLHVFGSGFMYSKPEYSEFCRPLKIHCLRGKLTRAICEKILRADLSDIPLGDPGLLVSRIYPHNQDTKKYDVGIICHYADDSGALNRKIKLERLNYTTISVSLPPRQFAEAVAECRCIISSAMHGLICADSYGVPNKHLILSDNVKGGTFKFKDYYSVYKNSVYEPLNIENISITDELVHDIISSYEVSHQEVSDICNRLQTIFSQKLCQIKRK